MNKKMLALMVTAAITLSSTGGYAADTTTNISLAGSSNPSVSSTIAPTKDTATKISLDDLTKLSVSLQSNSLVFNSDPTRETYDSIYIYLVDKKNNISTYTYKRGQVDGSSINLSDLSDGSYELRVFKAARGIGNRVMKYAFTIEVKGGVGNFKPSVWYAKNLKLTANERTDVYALDFYKYLAQLDYVKQAYVKHANLITAGITDDYLKAKAIADWVTSNLAYSFVEYPEDDGSFAELFPGSGVGKTAICVGFAGVTMELFQAAGFPAKYIVGGLNNLDHAWTEVYVDGRWVFVDATAGWFDRSIAEWSVTHDLGTSALDGLSVDTMYTWNGSLYIKKVGPNGVFQDKVLKEINHYPLGGLVTSTYGYNAKDMYSDAKCTKPWNFATDKVSLSEGYNTIYVKLPTHSITFDSQGGTTIKSVEVKPDANGYCKIPKPANPTRNGYTFAGWVVDNPNNSTVWDFKDWTINYDVTLYATWIKTTATKTNYTVSFNSQGGTAVKALTVNANSKLVKPANPTRKGYKFVSWYKDSKCTKVWNFATDKVTANTTIYAKWTK